MGDDRVALLLGAVFAAERQRSPNRRVTTVCPVWLAKPADTGSTQVWSGGSERALPGRVPVCRTRTAADVRLGRGRQPDEDGSVAGRRSPPCRRPLASRLRRSRQRSRLTASVRGCPRSVASTDDTVRCRSAARPRSLHPAPRSSTRRRRGGGRARCARFPGRSSPCTSSCGQTRVDGGMC